MYEIQEFEIRGERILNAVFSGQFNRQLIIRFINEMVPYEEKYPGYKLLVDFTNVAVLNIDINDITSIAEHVEKVSPRTGKTAYVAGDDHGKLMIVKLYVDLTAISRPGLQMACDSMEQAVDWLCPKIV